jgi:IMP dehydrogenase
MNRTSIIENKLVRHDALTFDDVLLLPNYTEVKRGDVNLTTKLHPTITLKIPVVSSPMDTVTEEKMAIELARYGGLGCIHRNLSVQAQSDMVAAVKHAEVPNPAASAIDATGKLLVSAAVGAGADLDERIASLINAGVDVICVDSSHGYSKFIMGIVSDIKKKYPHLVLMAGNVATFDGARGMSEAGADIIRVGMGPGSICTTRIVTGMGVPQLSAVAAAVRALDGRGTTIIADGGIRQMGDMAKALAFGAHAIMLGSMLAGYDQSPGDVVERGEKKWKMYRGMGSVSAMKKGGAERYGQSRDTEKKKLIAEGVEGLVAYKGDVTDFLGQIEGSLKSSFYYLGAPDMETFFRDSRAIKISTAGLIESHPHEIAITDAGGNYNK